MGQSQAEIPAYPVKEYTNNTRYLVKLHTWHATRGQPIDTYSCGGWLLLISILILLCIVYIRIGSSHMNRYCLDSRARRDTAAVAAVLQSAIEVYPNQRGISWLGHKRPQKTIFSRRILRQRNTGSGTGPYKYARQANRVVHNRDIF